MLVNIRSVKLWKQPRNLWVDNLVVHDTDKNEDITTSFDISIIGPMTEFNNKMMNKTEGYRVYYNPKENRIVFDCKSGYYFKTIIPYAASYSEDFKSITGTTNFYDYTYTNENSFDENQNLVCFWYDNVWNREDVHVRASFVDLGYKNFLGVSNEQFIPPKEYPISYTDKKFTIELFDSVDRPIELPADECGGLVIEAIMKSTI